MAKPKTAVKLDVMLAQRIEVWPLDRLITYDRNPRTHSQEQIERLAAMIAEFGWTDPILVDSEDGIVAGHGRLAAARHLGLTQGPVIVLDYLNPAQRRALVIAHNKISMEAGWDDARLQEELEALQLDGYNLDLTGFSSAELDVLIGDAGGADFIGGEGLQDGTARDNNNMEVLRGGSNPEPEKAMAGFWFRDVQVSVPMGIYERFEGLVNGGQFEDRRDAVVRILEAGMNHAEGLDR